MSAYKDAQANNDITRNVKQYKDLDLFFSKKTNKDLNKVTDIAAVKRSVRNLLLLNTFEKPIHPEIAGNMRGMLFENMTPLTAAVISRQVEDCINNFEPRARLVGVATTPDFDKNEYKVSKNPSWSLIEIGMATTANLFIAPIKLSEIIAALTLTAIFRTLIGLVPAALLAIPFFGVSIFN